MRGHGNPDGGPFVIAADAETGGGIEAKTDDGRDQAAIGGRHPRNCPNTTSAALGLHRNSRRLVLPVLPTGTVETRATQEDTEGSRLAKG